MHTAPFNRILITGGSEGIGFCTIKALLEDSNVECILTCSRNKEKNEFLNEMGKGRVIALDIDLSDGKSVTRLVEEAIKLNINTLVLNAVVTGVKAVDKETNSEAYVRAINQVSQILVVEGLINQLRKEKGFVIFMSSRLAHTDLVPDDMAIYADTKKEVEKYIIKISKFEENKEIKFLLFSPGSVKTRLHENIIHSDEFGSEHYQRTKSLIESDRLRDPVLIGRILSNIIKTGHVFNESSSNYDRDFYSGEYYDVNDTEYNRQTK